MSAGNVLVMTAESQKHIPMSEHWKGTIKRSIFGPMHKRGSCMVWEINKRVCPRLDFDNIMLFNCLGYNFNIYGAFEFLCNSIANL